MRDVGTVEAPAAPRAHRVGPVREGGSNAVDFMRFKLFGHVTGTSRVWRGFTLLRSINTMLESRAFHK